MDLQNQSLHLVMSTDAKPRLKWTPELHQRFMDAVNQLGGAEKATPKSLTRVMGIPGLTLYHLKSHLQKFRLGKSQQSDACSDNKHEDYSESHCSREINVGTKNQSAENWQIAQALQMQMEVEKKLHEQIEVQKHLQLRIEAQEKYLQSVLKKAQEALAGYNPSTASIELKKSDLSQLFLIINSGCPSSPISELTETREFSFKDGERKQNKGTMCSLESSLSSSESFGVEEEKQPMEEMENSNKSSVELSLMDFKPELQSKQSNGRKRSEEDGECVDQQFDKRCGNKLRRLEFCQMIDLNSQYQGDMDSGSKEIDLNLE